MPLQHKPGRHPLRYLRRDMTVASSKNRLTTPARRWLARLVLLGVATAASLKVGDVAVGWALQTQKRHLLRLPTNANYRHQSTEFDYQFVTNSLGLRGPERPFAKPAGTRRVVVIGDSTVAGYGVANDDVFTVKLEGLLRANSRSPFEVINVGRTGSSTIRELDLYTMIGRRFEPDVVVLAYFLGNDLREVVEEHDQEELRRWHPRGLVRRAAYGLCPNLYFELALLKISAETQQAMLPRSEESLLALLERECDLREKNFSSALDAYRRLPPEVKSGLLEGRLRHQQVLPACYDPSRLLRSLDPDDDYFNVAWPRTERHLEQFVREVEKDGARFVLMILPEPAQVDLATHRFETQIGFEVKFDWLTRSCRTRDALLTWAADKGVPCLDLLGDFRESQEQLYFPQDGHSNAAGHQRIAELLARFLQEMFGK